MTEQEALAAVEAAESKVESLKAEHDFLLQSIKDKRRQIAMIEQEISIEQNRSESISRVCWSRTGSFNLGHMPDAQHQLEHAKRALKHARSPKIQGVPALVAFGYSHSTEKSYILLYSGGEFRVQKNTGKVIGGVGIWRDLDPAELAALDAFVASLEGK